MLPSMKVEFPDLLWKLEQFPSGPSVTRNKNVVKELPENYIDAVGIT